MISDDDKVGLLFSDGEIIRSTVDNLWLDQAYFEEMDDFATPVVFTGTAWEAVTR